MEFNNRLQFIYEKGCKLSKQSSKMSDSFSELIQNADSDAEEYMGYDIKSNDTDSECQPVILLDEDEICLPVSQLRTVEREKGDLSHDAYEDRWLTRFMQPVGPVLLNDTKPYDIFARIISQDVIEFLVDQTNIYFINHIAKIGGFEKLPQSSRYQRWAPVTPAEMKAFFALFLYIGIVKLPHYRLYWSTHSLIKLCVGSIMSRDRFLNIMTFFHASESPQYNMPPEASEKVDTFARMLIKNWQRLYVPGREMCVGKCIIPYMSLQEYSSDVIKQGVKIWCLCDSQTGYVWNWKLPSTKASTDRTKTNTHHMIIHLCGEILNSGRHIYMDDYLASPALFSDLQVNQMGACGLIQSNRCGVPSRVKEMIPTDETPIHTERDGGLLYICWKDKTVSHLMSSVHNTNSFIKRVPSKLGGHRIVENPKAHGLYLKYMSGVDTVSKDISNNFNMECHRKLKWWKKVVLCNLLEICVTNARILYKQLNRKSRLDTEQFRLDIITGLLDGYKRPNKGYSRPVGDQPGRLTGRHFSSLNPVIKPSGRRSCPDCEVCSNRHVKRHQTIHFCMECKVPLCASPCFERYHTLIEYKIDCSDDLHKCG